MLVYISPFKSLAPLSLSLYELDPFKFCWLGELNPLSVCIYLRRIFFLVVRSDRTQSPIALERRRIKNKREKRKYPYLYLYRHAPTEKKPIFDHHRVSFQESDCFRQPLMAGSNEVNASESKRVVPLNTWILISNFKLAYNMLRRPDGTFNRDLNEYLDRKVPANTAAVDGVCSFDVIDRATSLLNRVYLAAGDNDAPWGYAALEKPLSGTEIVPVIIFFHGGSFVHSSANSAIYDTFCRRLVKTCGAAVVSVDYRRSPEHRYPCAYDDGWAALKWVHSRPWLRSGAGAGGKVHVYLAGDSSGGNIAHHVGVRAAEEGVEVLGNILLHPLFGGQERTESEMRLDGKYFVRVQDRDWYWRAYLPEGEDRDHPACNVFGHRSRSIEALNFPKSLVVVAGLDLLQDWQLGYVDGLRRSGHEVRSLYLEKATIGFYFLPNNDHFHCLMDEMKSFLHS